MAKKNAILIGEKVFRKLSPLQQKIIAELSLTELSLCDLSKKTGHNVFSTGKQLSILQFKTKYNPLVNKGITIPLVAKRKEANQKTIYSIIPKK